jgi:hypothetical protein
MLGNVRREETERGEGEEGGGREEEEGGRRRGGGEKGRRGGGEKGRRGGGGSRGKGEVKKRSRRGAREENPQQKFIHLDREGYNNSERHCLKNRLCRIRHYSRWDKLRERGRVGMRAEGEEQRRRDRKEREGRGGGRSRMGRKSGGEEGEW